MQTVAKLNTSGLQEVSASTTLSPLQDLGLTPEILSSAIVELAPENNETTLHVKSPLCGKASHKHKSSKILGPDSILKEKDCKPYWTDYCKEISSRLLSPTEIGLQDSLPNSWNSCSGETVANSWFSTDLKIVQKPNSQKIFSASSTYSLVASTVSGDTQVRSKRIRVYPTPDQGRIYEFWIQASRFVYNLAVEKLKGLEGSTPHWQGEFSKTILNELPDEMKKAPYQVKKIAIRDAIAALKEGKKRVAQGVISHFNLKFRSRKSQAQSCFIPKSAINKGGFYPDLSGPVFMTEKLPDHLMDSRLICSRGKWYISIPREVEQHGAENQGRVVSIDPGVRNFATIFSEEVFGHIGQGDVGRISNLCKHLDRLLTKHNGVRRRAAGRIRDKIQNLVSELHNKTVRFLVDSFDIILLPTFNVSQMVVKKARKLRRKSVRQMLTLSHYKFAQKLLDKAWENGKLVIRTNEAYTSKTNSWTGEINPNLGGSKTILVDGVLVDRDINGARGNFLRALVDTPSLQDCVVSIC